MTCHIVLVTYGEPRDPNFAAQLAYSWRILLGLTRTVAPIPRPLLPIIAVARARGRVRLWRQWDYMSPLEDITASQAVALAQSLARRHPGLAWQVHVAYEFRNPLSSTVLSSLPPTDPCLVIPMYVADSSFTHALSRQVVERLRPTSRGAIRVLPALDPATLAGMSSTHVRQQLEAHPAMQARDAAVILAAHGTLVDAAPSVDTGLIATQRVADALRKEFHDRDHVAAAWLNHSRGGRWTEPSVVDALAHVARAGFRRLVYFPYGFLADNAETQLEGRMALTDQPALDTVHLSCLNESPLLIEALTSQVLDTLASSRASQDL